MKAFIAIACLAVVLLSQAAPPTSTQTPPVDCDVSVSEDDWAVLKPNPEECESYYVCDAGIPIWMPCPEGLHFNPELLVCDWPEAANCTVGR